MTELNTKFFNKTVILRVIKAAVWGTLTFILVYYLPMMLIPKDAWLSIVPVDFEVYLLNFALISTFFAVGGQLLSGTIYGCGFGIAKAIIIMLFFFAISEGGILNVTFPFAETTLNAAVDISNILLMIVLVNLLSIAKNLFEAITILTQKSSVPGF